MFRCYHLITSCSADRTNLNKHFDNPKPKTDNQQQNKEKQTKKLGDTDFNNHTSSKITTSNQSIRTNNHSF